MENITYELVSQSNSFVNHIDKTKASKKITPPAKIDTLRSNKKQELLYSAYNKLENIKLSTLGKNTQIKDMHGYFARVIMHQQRIVSYSITCVIFFLIGSSLGSIIRKGGLGLPVVIAIVIFILFYVLNLSAENLAWAGEMDPYLAAWLPNLVLFPFGIWLTYKALTDSQLFDIEKYRALLKPIINRFSKNKEHQRYR